jgi:hypothetical protein
MNKPNLFLEAWRTRLYEALPVAKHWHHDYAAGKADAEEYVTAARESDIAWLKGLVMDLS